MATLKEHTHYLKVEISNYSKGFFLILLIDFTLATVGALCLYRIQECGDGGGGGGEPNGATGREIDYHAQVRQHSLRLCQLVNNSITNTEMVAICNQLKDSTASDEGDKGDKGDSTYSNRCRLTGLMFTKWFHFSSSVGRALGR